jgi:hypothetical protein
MITIQTNDSAVVTVKVQGQYPVGNWEYPFEFRAREKDYAMLLASNLREHLSRKIREAREEEYLAGWKDAKAKRAKRTWFKGVLS